ncbi:hypothetical protein LguiB_026014 [Lonicera macranthoides]
MGWFVELPEDCISNIISRTSPRDACRACSISLGFKSAADSDIVWEQFLPSDYPEILSGSAAPVVFSTKKELYVRLSHSHLLLDGGKMSFSLDKESGKKCYMVGARQLSFESTDNAQLWNWKSSPDSRFSEVAELLNVNWRVNILGKFHTRLLSQKTTYVAYFVFTFPKGIIHGRESACTSIRYLNKRENVTYKAAIHTSTTRIPTCRSGRQSHQSLHRLGQRRRKDGWMEIEMGQFFNDYGVDGEVEMRFSGFQFEKFGLIVEGIEFRPKHDSQ